MIAFVALRLRPKNSSTVPLMRHPPAGHKVPADGNGFPANPPPAGPKVPGDDDGFPAAAYNAL